MNNPFNHQAITNPSMTMMRESTLILTLKCMGVHLGSLGPMISIFASPVKTRKDFFPLFFLNCLIIGYESFGEGKFILAGHFHANQHKKALLRDVTKLVFAAIFKQNNFKNVNAFMFFKFESKFIETFLWESGFPNLVT